MTYDDPPITREEWLALHLIRAGKEPSRALQSKDYRNPARLGGTMHIKQADGKLQEWWVFSKLRDRQGEYPETSPMFREVLSSRQWESTSDIVEAWMRSAEMGKIEDIIDNLDAGHCAAISAEMRNREVGARVWRPGACAVSYDAALECVARAMRDAEII